MSTGPQPSGTLGFFSLVMLVVASMIGSGVFTTSGFSLALLHSPGTVVAAWIAGGIIALCGAVSYAMLARRISESGGEYVYLSRNLHPIAGLTAGLVSLTGGFSGAMAAAALTFAAYTSPYLESAVQLPQSAIASGLIAFIFLLYSFKIRLSVQVQNAGVIIKLAGIGLVIVLSLLSLGSFSTPIGSDLGSIRYEPMVFGESLLWIMFSYTGFNAAVYLAEDAKQQRHVGRAVITGTVLVIIIYVLLNAIFVYAAPADAISGQANVATLALPYACGEFCVSVINTVIIVSVFTSVCSLMMTGPWVIAKMAQDGYLPALLSIRYHRPNKVELACWLQMLLALLFVWVAALRDIMSFLGLTLSLSSALTVATLFFGQGKKQLLIFPAIYILGILAIAGISIATSKTADISLAIFIVLVVIASLGYGIKNLSVGRQKNAL